MTYKSPEFLTEYVRILNEVVSYADCNRRLGMAESTVFVWLRASKAAAERKDDPSEWLLEIDGEKRYFHQFCRQASVNAVENIAANAIVRARDGVWTEAKFQGNTVYRLNPDWIDESMRYLLGLTDADKYLRVNGRLVPELVYTPPSTDLTAFILAANSKRYRKQSSVTVDARVSGGGVFRWESEKPKVAAPIPVEMIEDASKFAPAELAVFAEITDEPERPLTDEIAATDTDPDEPPAVPVDEPEPEPATPTPPATGPVIATPTPPEYQPAGPNPLIVPRSSGRPLSDLERDLLSKLPGGLSR
jgi:hypothetical protein